MRLQTYLSVKKKNKEKKLNNQAFLSLKKMLIHLKTNFTKKNTQDILSDILLVASRLLNGKNRN